MLQTSCPHVVCWSGAVPRCSANFIVTRPLPCFLCSAVVLFVVQPGERNILDQRVLEHALWAHHRVPVRRVTLEWLGTHGRLGRGCYVQSGASAASEHCLLIPREFPAAGDGAGDSSAAATVPAKMDEVSVVYYRSGYSPGDFTSEACWAAKLTAERSVAVKCPPILYHLAGTKKVQQALALPGAVERLVPAPVAAHLRRCFAGLWSLDPAERDAEAVSTVLLLLQCTLAMNLSSVRCGSCVLSYARCRRIVPLLVLTPLGCFPCASPRYDTIAGRCHPRRPPQPRPLRRQAPARGRR